MRRQSGELAALNRALAEQEKVVTTLEDQLFLEQLRLASLKAARQRALGKVIGFGANDEDTDE